MRAFLKSKIMKTVSVNTIRKAAEKGFLNELWEAVRWDSFTEEEFIFDYLTNHDEEE